jgi:hypothetical protein
MWIQVLYVQYVSLYVQYVGLYVQDVGLYTTEVLYGLRFNGKKPVNVSRALDQLWFPGPLLAAGPSLSVGSQLATSSWPCGPPQSFNPMGAMQGFHTTVVTLRQVLTNQRQETTILLPYENHFISVFQSSHYPFYHLVPN